MPLSTIACSCCFGRTIFGVLVWLVDEGQRRALACCYIGIAVYWLSVYSLMPCTWPPLLYCCCAPSDDDESIYWLILSRPSVHPSETIVSAFNELCTHAPTYCDGAGANRAACSFHKKQKRLMMDDDRCHRDFFQMKTFWSTVNGWFLYNQNTAYNALGLTGKKDYNFFKIKQKSCLFWFFSNEKKNVYITKLSWSI